MFYFGRTYQGAKGPMYPYPLMDRLTEKKQEKNYRAVNLENEYVKFSILPESGGVYSQAWTRPTVMIFSTGSM